MDLGLILNPLQSLQEKIQQTAGEFSLKRLATLPNLDAMNSYATQHLRLLGQGSSRMVYEFNKMALKIAYHSSQWSGGEPGLAQNALEARISMVEDDVVADVFYSDPKHRFLVTELAREVKSSEFTKYVGFWADDVREYLQTVFRAYHLDDEDEYWISPEEARQMIRYLPKGIGKAPFVKRLQSLMMRFGISPFDFKLQNFGIVQRGGQPAVVMLDAGFNEQVNSMEYTNPA